MANSAYTNIIAFGDINSINQYEKSLITIDHFLDTRIIRPYTVDFYTESFNESTDNLNGKNRSRIPNWETLYLPIVHSQLKEIFPMEYAIHSTKIETRYCPPYSIIEKLIDDHLELKFLIQSEYESDESILEYYDNKLDSFHKLFSVKGFCLPETLDSLDSSYLKQFEDIEISEEICRALSYTTLGKIFLDLKYPDGLPINLLHIFNK